LRYRILNNKKSGAPVDEFAAFIIFVIIAVLIIFWIRINDSSKENAIKDEIFHQKIVLDAHSNLLSFLKQQNKNEIITNIFLDSYYSKDFNATTRFTQKFFNDKYSNDWILVLEDSSNNLIFSIDSDKIYPSSMAPTDTAVKSVIEAAFVYLPLNPPMSSKHLKLSLFLRMPKEGVIVK